MTKPTISETIKVWQQKMPVSKENEPGDSKCYIIYLTEVGKSIATKTSFFTEKIRTPIDNLHEDDKENQLLSLLSIIRHLNKSGIITIQRMCLTCLHYENSEQGKKTFLQIA